ncbi:MAG: nucleoside phosphorylase [Promethearchaeota archaeon]
MDSRDFPIIEYDDERNALVNPSQIVHELDVPEHCLFPFYFKTLERLKKKGILKVITYDIGFAIPPYPLYELEHNGKRLAVMTSGLGAPFAAGNLEFAIASGCKKFLAFGSCGVLDKTIARGQFIIPTAAIRDEGTSYHYIPPSREISADPNIITKIQKSLDAKQIKYICGKTWTTDAFYRETPKKIEKRKREGAIIVEMEASALFAVAQFRNVQLGYILAGSDDISGIEWDPRISLRARKFPEKFFWLAVEVCLEL